MSDQKKKNQQSRTRQNVLESLKDLGIGAGSQTGDFLKNTSEDFFKELMGIPLAEYPWKGNFQVMKKESRKKKPINLESSFRL
jgi:hypothetical protein